MRGLEVAGGWGVLSRSGWKIEKERIAICILLGCIILCWFELGGVSGVGMFSLRVGWMEVGNVGIKIGYELRIKKEVTESWVGRG